MKVLYLGATGLVGRNVVPILKENYDLTLAAKMGGTIADLPVLDVDITDFEEVEALLQNGTAEGEPFDAVVNCAIADYRNYRSWDTDERHDYHERCIEVNARGAYHVYEAAWRTKTPRVVYIGSMTAVLGAPSYDYIDAESRERPADVYAACKLFGEHVGRTFAYRYTRTGQQMQVLCLRLGQPYPPGRPLNKFPEAIRRVGDRPRRPQGSLAVDMRDIAQAIECALRSQVQFGTYPVISHTEDNYVDPELYAELGYQPRWRFTEEGAVPYEGNIKEEVVK